MLNRRAGSRDGTTESRIISLKVGSMSYSREIEFDERVFSE